MGTGVAGTSKCATYQITIDLTVDGKAVKGSFKQQGRPERPFAATLDDKGAFKTRADVGEGNTMDVSGTLADKDGRRSCSMATASSRDRSPRSSAPPRRLDRRQASLALQAVVGPRAPAVLVGLTCDSDRG